MSDNENRILSESDQHKAQAQAAGMVHGGHEDEVVAETVTLVAVSLTHPEEWDVSQIQDNLAMRLNQQTFRTLYGPWHVDSWWFAEDERYDRSDNDSAVFIPRSLTQVQARRALVFLGDINQREGTPFFVGFGADSALSEAARTGRDLNIAGAHYVKVNHGGKAVEQRASGHIETIMRAAYGLLGDGDGGEWEGNPEYTRAITELVRDACYLQEWDHESVLERIRERGEDS